MAAIEARLAKGRSLMDLSLDGADGQGLHWLYEHTEVMKRQNAEDGRVKLTVRVAPETVERVRRRFASAVVHGGLAARAARSPARAPKRA